MLPWRRGACRLQGQGDLKNPQGLAGDTVRAGGREADGRGDWLEAVGTPPTQMPLRASAAYQALPQTRTSYFYYFLFFF